MRQENSEWEGDVGIKQGKKWDLDEEKIDWLSGRQLEILGFFKKSLNFLRSSKWIN